MINVQQQFDVTPNFSANPVADHNAAGLGDICLYLTHTNYHYLTIAEATKLRDVLTRGIDLAIVAKQARYEKALAIVTKMGEVSA